MATTIKDFIGSVKRGTMGVQMVTITEPKMNKRNNPFYGRVKKVTYLSNVMLGYDYENTVNSRREKEGKECDFTADGMSGREWDMYPYILQSTKNQEQKYLRTTMVSNTTSKVIYIIDGNKTASDDEVSIIKSFMPKSNSAQKQGLDYEVVVRDFKVENIVFLKQGTNEYNRINLPINLIKKVF